MKAKILLEVREVIASLLYTPVMLLWDSWHGPGGLETFSAIERALGIR